MVLPNSVTVTLRGHKIRKDEGSDLYTILEQRTDISVRIHAHPSDPNFNHYLHEAVESARINVLIGNIYDVFIEPQYHIVYNMNDKNVYGIDGWPDASYIHDKTAKWYISVDDAMRDLDDELLGVANSIIIWDAVHDKIERIIFTAVRPIDYQQYIYLYIATNINDESKKHSTIEGLLILSDDPILNHVKGKKEYSQWSDLRPEFTDVEDENPMYLSYPPRKFFKYPRKKASVQ